MSIHSSLRNKAGMTGHRNVLTRVERLEKLEGEGRWSDSDSVCGLSKVRSIKAAVKKKKKKTAGEEEA